MKNIIVIVLLVTVIAGCSTQQQLPAERTVRGVLEYFPSDVRSSQAWHGHNFIVDRTPILPTDAVPEEVLKGYVGDQVIVTGIWHPGERWEPTKDDMTTQMPVYPEGQMIIRGDGLKASSIEREARQE